jgi:hypothetical protein
MKRVNIHIYIYIYIHIDIFKSRQNKIPEIKIIYQCIATEKMEKKNVPVDNARK